ncbi:hypothetical protein TSOC_001335 [Tetrabaena socialis]|uniref:Uncharacterized protein n=1 Tax=Tetrabaena socialis TaxID=47790 RepID=A0A2J8AH36_9CHLO|nr:hypothetical protein TSOC_001335 [Tetrabaena socialis]|eukprot:PNH11839.1 hypothetical protein TSOC_001335 [Tetrabaena socialis]
MSPHKLVVLLVTALAISAGSIVQGGDQPRPVASIYNGNAGVLDLKWDDGPMNVRKQFELLGIDVHEATAPDTVGLSSVFVIPAQNGPVMYAAAEDMSVVASFVAAGGLVIILDGQDGGDASLKSFVSQALGYSGDWSICKRFSDNTRTKTGEPQRSTFATTFLGDAGSWPETLEEAPIISVRSWCAHTDPQAVSWPLYNLDGDDMQATAQAFSKVGTSGAVVWLGYTWKGGAQDAWGHLLDHLIRDFNASNFHTPTAGTRAEMESAYPLQLTSAVHPHEQQFFVEEQPVDTLLFTASDMSTDSMDVVRRMMQTGGSFGAYPSPPAAEPPTPPPGLALPPAPPGFSVKIEDYNSTAEKPTAQLSQYTYLHVSG